MNQLNTKSKPASLSRQTSTKSRQNPFAQARASSRKLAPGMVTIAEAEVGMLPFFAVKIIPGSAILSQVQALSFPKIFLNGDLQDMVRYGCIF